MFKVLIIDDEEIIREGLITVIDWNSIDCEVIGEAEDGDDGIEKVASLKPDIVFTDIRMPGLDGLEMISKVRALKNDCKIIILTGFRDFEYAQRAVKLGAFRFILKPSKPEEIMSAIYDAIEELKSARSTVEEFNNLKKKVKEYYGLEEVSKDNSCISPNTRSSAFLVNKALEYMKTNFSKNLNLKSVADELYISTWHLSKILKKETGSTFIDILNEIRIHQAKKLLSDNRYKIYEVAEMVGFEDVPYFNKLFKKLTALTPMEFKNSNIKN